MEATYSKYVFDDSRARIAEILDESDASYEDHKGIPARDNLTFTNGFYVDVTVVFIDIRGSKQLATEHTRPVLAKIYRSYISETVAILKGVETISEVYIEGDGIWAVFNTVTKKEVEAVFEGAARISSLVKYLNKRLTKKGYKNFKVGIGIEDGGSLYIKAGYKGSGINEVVWIGKSIGSAAKLCGFGNKNWFDGEMMISDRVRSFLKDDYQKWFTWRPEYEAWSGDVCNVFMNAWIEENE